MTILLFALIGLVVGIASGTVGIGGGVLLVPALIWLCEFEPRKAAGTSLAILSLPIVLPAAWKYYTARSLDLEAALWIAPSFMVGGYLGASLAQQLNENAIRCGFGLMLLLVGMRFVLHSHSLVASAGAGFIAFIFAGLAFWALYVLGRRHLSAPDLGAHIRRKQQEGHGDIDYHI